MGEIIPQEQPLEGARDDLVRVTPQHIDHLDAGVEYGLERLRWYYREGYAISQTPKIQEFDDEGMPTPDNLKLRKLLRETDKMLVLCMDATRRQMHEIRSILWREHETAKKIEAEATDASDQILDFQQRRRAKKLEREFNKAGKEMREMEAKKGLDPKAKEALRKSS